ncbi:MAG: glutamate--tRNA ligase [Desulfobulbaceae bacterium]|jgi:glutamyl-tRNA synthetase|nr:glutamate--tRNA ligase [Desulfobulbaceae bacterium]
MTEIRLRFPPSPTGYLHIGGARTALYNWLYARKMGGKLILRIEDTDSERSTEASTDGILDGLKWLGIDYDEGPYFQSHFAANHRAAAQRLLDSGHAYKCFCAKEELEVKRQAALAAKLPFVGYDRACRHLTPEQIAAKEDAGLPHVIRFKTPDRQGMLGYNDMVLGRIEVNYKEIDDFVIVRSDGSPLYLLCNVADDIRDRISHVVRGQDHMTNTLKQVLLYEALAAPLPIFAHIPLTLDNKKAKISKRSHGEVVAVQFYKEMGFLPWAFNNYLVLLGWSPGTDQEFFSRDELISAFSLERINKSSAIFNYTKGDAKFFTDPKAIAINEHYLRTMPIAELAPLVEEELRQAGIWDEAYADEKRSWFLEVITLIRDRFHTLKDFSTAGRAYFAEDYVIEEKPLKKNVAPYPELKNWLPLLADRLAALNPFTAERAEETARAMAEELSQKPGVLMNAMRAILTGQLAGPAMFDILLVIGQETVVRRLRQTERLFPAQ